MNGVDANYIMNKAIEIVSLHNADRDKTNERAMREIVEVFNTLTGHCLSEYEGNLFMICLKLVRMFRNPKELDNYVDAIGYIGLTGETRDIQVD